MEQFSTASINKLDEIKSIYDKTKEHLIEHGIFQWGDWGGGYPGETFIAKSILRNELFVYSGGECIIGVVALNAEQPAEWSSAAWSDVSGCALVIHALAIDPQYQRKGFGSRILSAWEGYAHTNGYEAVRLDSFAKNPASNRLYEKNGYSPVGSVFFDSKPEGNREYVCYEKILV
jgi:GNAT superfamily N-acetyltransferase